MSDPRTHSENSVEHFGGKPEDYLEIHEFLDSSGLAFCDLRHRAATHNTWFIKTMLPAKFGHKITNSDGKEVSVVLIGQWHVLEDYGGRFIPTLQDFLMSMRLEAWMDNGRAGASPPSQRGRPDGTPFNAESTDLGPPDISDMLALEWPHGNMPAKTGGTASGEPVRGCRGGPPGTFD